MSCTPSNYGISGVDRCSLMSNYVVLGLHEYETMHVVCSLGSGHETPCIVLGLGTRHVHSLGSGHETRA